MIERFCERVLETCRSPPDAVSRSVSVAPDEELVDRVAALLHAAGYWGLAQVDLMGSARGPLLLDVNPRFYGCLPNALRCGAELATRLHAVACGDPPAPRRLAYPAGVTYRWLEADLSAALMAGDWGRLWRRTPAPRVGAMWSPPTRCPRCCSPPAPPGSAPEGGCPEAARDRRRQAGRGPPRRQEHARRRGRRDRRQARLARALRRPRSLGRREPAGVFVLAFAFLQIVMVPIDLGFDRYLLRQVALERTRLPHLVANVLVLKLLLVVPVFGIAFGLLFALGYSEGDPRTTVYVLAGGLLLELLSTTPISAFTAYERNESRALTSLVQRLSCCSASARSRSAGASWPWRPCTRSAR